MSRGGTRRGRRSGAIIAMLALVAGLAVAPTLTATAAGDDPGSYAYAPSDDLFPNPERGLYSNFQSITRVTDADLKSVTAEGWTIVKIGVDLSEFVSQQRDIDQTLLDQMQATFDLVRSNGLKAWIHVSYSQHFDPASRPGGEGPWRTSCPDPEQIYVDVPSNVDVPLPWVLTHIGQLRDIFARNTDAIMGFDAGYIGEWGEWHCSANTLLASPHKQEIVAALLENLPADRQIAMRHPYDIFDPSIYRIQDPSNHWSDPASRLTDYQDCYASSDPYDEGTWVPSLQENRADQATISSLKQRVGVLGAHHIIGGDACNKSVRAVCDVAVTGTRSNTGEPTPADPFPLQYDAPEMPLMHFTYLLGDFQNTSNSDYVAGGCWDDIQRSLGYRLQLNSADLPTHTTAGRTQHVTVNLTNVGWAAVGNPRPVFLVMTGPGGSFPLPLDADPRAWQPGQDATIDQDIVIPETVSPGEYTLSLWMPDAYASVRSNPAYSIRFANADVWDSATGTNQLGALTVAPVLPATGSPPTALAGTVLASAVLLALGAGTLLIARRRRAATR